MADKTIAELAPSLVAVGLTEDEIKEKATSLPAKAVVGQHAIIQPKRYREALSLISDYPSMSDVEVASKVASMRPEVVAELRKELAAVKASPTAKTTAEVEAAKESEGGGK